MSLSSIFICLIGLGAFSFFFCGARIRKLSVNSDLKLHSRSVYHGSFLLICTTFVPLDIADYLDRRVAFDY